MNYLKIRLTTLAIGELVIEMEDLTMCNSVVFIKGIIILTQSRFLTIV